MKEWSKVTITFPIAAALGILSTLAQIKPIWSQPSQPRTESKNHASILRLPNLTGPYRVGTTSYHLVDSSRKETYRSEVYDLQTRQLITSPPPTDRRELMVYVWYPAKAVQRVTPAPFLDEAFAVVVSKLMGPAFGVTPDLFIKLTTQTVQTNSMTQLPLASSQNHYPVVIFSPGFGSSPKWYTSQIEQLASHGYVVVGINPTYEVPVGFPNGRVFTQSTVFNFRSASKQTENDTFDQAVTVRARDVSFVLNELQRLNMKDPQELFSGRLDLSQIGIFGHSLGADTAVEAMQLDRRIKTGISMDCGKYGKLLNPESKDRLDRPLMVMSRENQADPSKLLYQRLTNDAYSLVIKGSKHNTFTDFGLILTLFSAYSTETEPPIKQSVGSIESQQAAKIINAYTLAFFNKYLKNQNSPLLKGTSPDYPEAVMAFRHH